MPVWCSRARRVRMVSMMGRTLAQVAGRKRVQNARNELRAHYRVDLGMTEDEARRKALEEIPPPGDDVA
jgi:hypothetical protein